MPCIQSQRDRSILCDIRHHYTHIAEEKEPYLKILDQTQCVKTYAYGVQCAHMYIMVYIYTYTHVRTYKYTAIKPKQTKCILNAQMSPRTTTCSMTSSIVCTKRIRDLMGNVRAHELLFPLRIGFGVHQF
jgi:hypothetical protein